MIQIQLYVYLECRSISSGLLNSTSRPGQDGTCHHLPKLFGNVRKLNLELFGATQEHVNDGLGACSERDLSDSDPIVALLAVEMYGS